MTDLENLSRGQEILIKAGAIGRDALGEVCFEEEKSAEFISKDNGEIAVRVPLHYSLIAYPVSSVIEYVSEGQ